MGLEEGKLPKNYDYDYAGGRSAPPTAATPPKADDEALDIFRSAPMSLLQLYIPIETAQATVAELGILGLVQFRDVSQICGVLGIYCGFVYLHVCFGFFFASNPICSLAPTGGLSDVVTAAE
jgi:hypothetical protein